jgi:hypothetical protein
MATSDMATGQASVRSLRRPAAGAAGRGAAVDQVGHGRHAASTSRNHTVPGTLPACSSASVSAPKATNSPCGMKITRVTANTSTVASASSA